MQAFRLCLEPWRLYRCTCCVYPGHGASVCEQCVSTALGFWKILSNRGRLWRLLGEDGERPVSGERMLSAKGVALPPSLTSLCWINEGASCSKAVQRWSRLFSWCTGRWFHRDGCIAYREARCSLLCTRLLEDAELEVRAGWGGVCIFTFMQEEELQAVFLGGVEQGCMGMGQDKNKIRFLLAAKQNS